MKLLWLYRLSNTQMTTKMPPNVLHVGKKLVENQLDLRFSNLKENQSHIDTIITAVTSYIKEIKEFETFAQCFDINIQRYIEMAIDHHFDILNNNAVSKVSEVSVHDIIKKIDVLKQLEMLRPKCPSGEDTLVVFNKNSIKTPSSTYPKLLRLKSSSSAKNESSNKAISNLKATSSNKARSSDKAVTGDKSVSNDTTASSSDLFTIGDKSAPIRLTNKRPASWQPLESERYYKMPTYETRNMKQDTYLPAHQRHLSAHYTIPNTLFIPPGRDIRFWCNGYQHILTSLNLISIIAVDCMKYHECITLQDTIPLDSYVFEFQVKRIDIENMLNKSIDDVCSKYLDFFEKKSPNFRWGSYYKTKKQKLYGYYYYDRTIWGLCNHLKRMCRIILKKIP